jgi:hypothetical protein
MYFLPEVTQHIPEQGEHLIRYYGWYSNKKPGERAKRLPKPVSFRQDSYRLIFSKNQESELGR